MPTFYTHQNLYKFSSLQLLTTYILLITIVNCFLFLSKVPYEFCEMYYWTNNSYVTNYTINDSDFITAKAVMDFIQNSTSFQNNCSNRMLIFTPKRFIKRFPENQGYSVLYNITIKVKKVYLFNKSLLNDSLTDVIGKCTTLGASKAIFDKPLFDKYLTLTLNVSGRLLKIMIKPSGPQGPGEPTCNIEKPVCPTTSKEINNSTCGRFINIK